MSENNDKKDIMETEIHPALLITVIAAVVAIIIWQPMWGTIFIASAFILSLLIILLAGLIKSKKYWNFNRDYIIVAILWIGGFLSFFGIAIPEYGFCIVMLGMLVTVILSFVISTIMNNLFYNKDRSLYKLRFKAQNFIRPNQNPDINNFIELANKFCIVRIDTDIICFNKKTNKKWKISRLGNAEAIRRYEILAKLFTFETTADDVLTILKNIDVNTSPLYLDEPYYKEFETISINNMSVAELICLPGINMGKAYKIHKYLQTNTFNNKEEFINFAQISNEDADYLMISEIKFSKD